MQIHVKKIITMTKITVSSLAIVEQGVWDDKFKFIFSSNKVNCLCVKFRYWVLYVFRGLLHRNVSQNPHECVHPISYQLYFNYLHSDIFSQVFNASVPCMTVSCVNSPFLYELNTIWAIFENIFPNFIIHSNFLQILNNVCYLLSTISALSNRLFSTNIKRKSTFLLWNRGKCSYFTTEMMAIQP